MGAACENPEPPEDTLHPTAIAEATATRTSVAASAVIPATDSIYTATTTPTATATAIATWTPTVTVLPPTATPTPPPTATVIPSPTPVPTPVGPSISIGDSLFGAEIADTPELRSKGLGERDNLAEQTGLLFIFQSGQASSFWMKGMRFPLDFVWIGEDCTVVDLTENVRHSSPETPSSELEIFESASPATYTFEINAGEVRRFDIEIGDDVRFNGIESEFARCCESGVCNGE